MPACSGRPPRRRRRCWRRPPAPSCRYGRLGGGDGGGEGGETLEGVPAAAGSAGVATAAVPPPLRVGGVRPMALPWLVNAHKELPDEHHLCPHPAKGASDVWRGGRRRSVAEGGRWRRRRRRPLWSYQWTATAAVLPQPCSANAPLTVATLTDERGQKHCASGEPAASRSQKAGSQSAERRERSAGGLGEVGERARASTISARPRARSSRAEAARPRSDGVRGRRPAARRAEAGEALVAMRGGRCAARLLRHLTHARASFAARRLFRLAAPERRRADAAARTRRCVCVCVRRLAPARERGRTSARSGCVSARAAPPSDGARDSLERHEGTSPSLKDLAPEPPRLSRQPGYIKPGRSSPWRSIQRRLPDLQKSDRTRNCRRQFRGAFKNMSTKNRDRRVKALTDRNVPYDPNDPNDYRS